MEKVLDLWAYIFELMKNGGKNKSVMFIILLRAFHITVMRFYYYCNKNWKNVLIYLENNVTIKK